jgi:hypothetical protein
MRCPIEVQIVNNQFNAGVVRERRSRRTGSAVALGIHNPGRDIPRFSLIGGVVICE